MLEVETQSPNLLGHTQLPLSGPLFQKKFGSEQKSGMSSRYWNKAGVEGGQKWNSRIQGFISDRKGEARSAFDGKQTWSS